MTDGLSRKFKKKREYNFVVPPLRRSRYFDALATVKKIRGVCTYKASPKTVQTIEQFKESLEKESWGVSDRVCISIMKIIIESVIKVLYAQTSTTIQIKKTLGSLMQIMDLVFSRCNPKSPQAIPTLYSILSQLAFGFSFKEGTNHPVFSIFRAFTGVMEKTSGLPNVERLLLMVVLTSEIMRFVVDVIHLYCTKYDTEHLTEARRISLACLTIHDDSELIDYLSSLKW